MIRVCFLCHGNICRSTMAEFVFKDFVSKKGTADKFYICSKALHNDEIGSPVHYGTARILDRIGIDYKIVRAACGAMGGTLSEEYQARSGEGRRDEGRPGNLALQDLRL